MIRYVIWDVDRVASMGFVGAVQVCRFLAMAGGKSFLCTERDADLLADFAHVYGLEDYVADSICSSDGVAATPDPEGYNLLIGIHQLARDEVLLVSEREEAIMAGRAAGIRTCRLWAGAKPDVMADWTVGNCSELYDMLRGEAVIGATPRPEPRYSIHVGELLRYADGMLQPEPVR